MNILDTMAGAYVALTLTMWVTGLAFVVSWWKNKRLLEGAAAALYLGIGISFIGHGTDQMLWTYLNVERAALDGNTHKVSNWYMEQIPYMPFTGKFLASFGAFFHLHVLWFAGRGWPTSKSIAVLTTLWTAVMAGTALAIP